MPAVGGLAGGTGLGSGQGVRGMESGLSAGGLDHVGTQTEAGADPAASRRHDWGRGLALAAVLVLVSERELPGFSRAPVEARR